jgi:hypothetical protein
MKNWTTTVGGVVAALPQIAIMFGVTAVPVDVWNGISAIGLFLIGLLAKDNNVTGGSTKQ